MKKSLLLSFLLVTTSITGSPGLTEEVSAFAGLMREIISSVPENEPYRPQLMYIADSAEIVLQDPSSYDEELIRQACSKPLESFVPAEECVGLWFLVLASGVPEE